MKPTIYPTPKPDYKKLAPLFIELTLRADKAKQAKAAARLSDNKPTRKVVKNR